MGCTALGSDTKLPIPTTATITWSEPDELLAFGTDVIAMTQEQQISACIRVKNEADSQNNHRFRLRLALTLMLAPSCDSQPHALHLVNQSISETQDKRTKQVLSLLSSLLAQVLQLAESEKRGNNENTALSKETTLLREELKNTRLELQSMHSKLEQLIEMEQILNQRKQK